MTKVDIISGFLGAGKTTYIKHLIEKVYTGEKLVLIENEFGEIGIDSGFLKDSGVEITEMNSGCICCTLVGDFSKALIQVLDTYRPDRVIIEPSGVGKLSDVMGAVENVKKETEIEIEGAVAVVDGKKTKPYSKNFGEFYKNQIESAATVVVSRTQNLTEKELDECVALIKNLNAKASIITTPWDALTKEAILNAYEADKKNLIEADVNEHISGYEHHHEHTHEHHHENTHEHHHEHGEHCDCGCHDHEHHHDHHHADEVFTSWGVETVHKYTNDELTKALKELSDTTDYGTILRAKGIVSGKDGTWMQFDMVPKEYQVREGSPDYTGRICVIGTELKEDALQKLFHL